MASDLGVHNPLRYRGYVYDQEVGLYYLQSRYYNAGLGRFNAPDAFTSTGQGLLGNNMFAYCLNNPVAFSDATGNAAMVCFNNDAVDPALSWKVHGGGRTNYNGGMSSPPTKPKSFRIKLSFWKMLFNTNAQAASDAEHYAFYNGVPIIKVKAMGNAAFSFGVIFMGPNSNANLVKHEYGHVRHLLLIGSTRYAKKVALPSVVSFWTNRNNKYYESQPWEYIAEYLGDTEAPPNGYLPFAAELANIYGLYTILP